MTPSRQPSDAESPACATAGDVSLDDLDTLFGALVGRLQALALAPGQPAGALIAECAQALAQLQATTRHALARQAAPPPARPPPEPPDGRAMPPRPGLVHPHHRSAAR